MRYLRCTAGYMLQNNDQLEINLPKIFFGRFLFSKVVLDFLMKLIRVQVYYRYQLIPSPSTGDDFYVFYWNIQDFSEKFY